MSERPKVLYAIQGTGNGHVSRARALYPELIKHFDVDLALVGNNSEVQLPKKPIWKGMGVTMYYSEKGGIDFFKTIFSNSLLRIRRELRSIPVERYDFILNDFESISIRAAKKKGVPILGISHQSAVWNAASPKPGKLMPLGKWVLNHYARCRDNIGFHFQSYASDIFQPIIRDEILTSKWTPGEQIIVYLPAYGSSFLSEVLKSTSFTYLIFHKEALSSINDGNIQWEPIDGNKFSEELIRSRGVICSAGFELPSECLHLGIPFAVLPINGQYEQWCNAAALAKIGVPVLDELSSDTVEGGVKTLLEKPPIQLKPPDVRKDVSNAIISWWKRMRN